MSAKELITVDEFDNFPQTDNHIYVYLRVSKGSQEVISQLNEVYNYCVRERLYPPKKNIYIDEGISGKVSWRERKIFTIIESAKKKDVIIVPEISRLGRQAAEINLITGTCSEKKITIIDVKNNLKLDDSLGGLTMITLCGIFSQMERNLISERTKQGLIIAKQKGHLKGRKRGIRKNRLDGHEEEIKKMLNDKIKIVNIAKQFGVDHSQLIRFIKKHNLRQEQ